MKLTSILCMLVVFVSVSSFANRIKFRESKTPFRFGKVCPPLAGKSWRQIRKDAKEIYSLDAEASGVVLPPGKRTIFEKRISNCSKGYSGITIRFSEDVTNDGTFFEVFVKLEDPALVTGFALDSHGTYQSIVPKSVARDKDGNKEKEFSIEEDDRVRSRDGCFACHSTVSFDYDIPDAATFWNVAPIKALPNEGILTKSDISKAIARYIGRK